MEKINNQPICIGGGQAHATVKYDGICTTLCTFNGALPMIVSIEPRTPKAVGEVANGLTRTAKDNLVAEIKDGTENDKARYCAEQ